MHLMKTNLKSNTTKLRTKQKQHEQHEYHSRVNYSHECIPEMINIFITLFRRVNVAPVYYTHSCINSFLDWFINENKP